MRHLGVVCALAAGIASSAAPLLAADRSLPMRFELRQDAADCTSRCKTWISASGAITGDTPIAFRNFASGRNLQGATVVLDSDGGSVLGAIALGRQIRDLKLATTVGALADVAATKNGAMIATFSSHADCESMCAFVLLAGVERSVAPDARVMVHQIWLGDRREDPTAATYSAEDLVLVQRDIGRLAKYTADMGGPADLLELALRIPPWEPMHALSRAELRQMGFEGPDVIARPVAPRSAPPISAPATTVAYTPATSGNQPDALGEHGWSMLDRSGVSVLARRHPLTIEGEEIGSFDLLVTCGSDDGYLVTYREQRRAEAGLPFVPLNDVTVRVGSVAANLKVVTSAVEKNSGVLTTTAAGTVPLSLIKSFTAPGSHSLMVGTVADTLRTAIRVGNFGAHRHLPVLASACQKSGAKRAELPAQKAGGAAQR